MRRKLISRRQMITYVGGAVLGVGVATACRPLSSVPSSQPTTGPGVATAAGGTFIYGATAPIGTTSPYPNNSASIQFQNALFNALVNLDAQRQPVPELAESWAISENHLSLTLKLRSDVVFHSGRSMTADDVKWNFDFALDPKNGSQVATGLKGATIRATDASMLVVQLPDILPEVFSLLASIQIVDPESDIVRAAGGTGPFKVAAFEPGNQLQMTKHTRYWRAGHPLLDAVTIRTILDPAAVVVNLESGAIMVGQCPANEVKRLQAGPQTAVTLVPGPGNWEYLVSAVDPPFADKRVRQAMGLALDRKRFAETMLYGTTEPTYLMWPRTSPAWDAKLDMGEFNLDRARALLVEAGYPNGFETTLQGSSASFPPIVKFAEVFQADLARIGVKLTIQDLESSQATAVLQVGKFRGMFGHAHAFGDQDPALLFTAFPFRPDGNASRFTSGEYATLVMDARREPNWEKRLGLYRRIGGLVKDEAFALPVANQVYTFAQRKHVHDFAARSTGGAVAPVYEDIWLA